MDFENLKADVNKILSVHYTKGRAGNKINKIVVHYNAGNLTVEGCYNVWLTRAASAHYQVEESGRVGQLVWDSDMAWHAGNTNANLTSIGVEHANYPNGCISDKCLDTGAHLVAALCKYYGLGRPQWLKNVYPHHYFSATSCPGQIYGSQKNAYIQRAQYWYDIMTGAAEEEKPSKPAEPEKPKKPLPAALAEYKDIDSEAWYVNALDKAVQAGYLHGYNDTTMGPNDPVLRGQAVCMIGNAAGFKAEHPYSDVVASPYYYDSVEWAKENGVVSADQKSFRPTDNCLRCEFIAMLYNWKGTKPSGDTANFSDWDSVPDWAKEAVVWASEAGVVNGYGGKLRPTDYCTRAEAAAMLVNLLQ